MKFQVLARIYVVVCAFCLSSYGAYISFTSESLELDLTSPPSGLRTYCQPFLSWLGIFEICWGVSIITFMLFPEKCVRMLTSVKER